MWEPTVLDAQNGILSGSSSALPLNMHVEGQVPQQLMDCHGVSQWLLVTNGDGSCGLHARFGEPALAAAGEWELRCEGARQLLQHHLHRLLQILKQTVRESAWALQAMEASIWSEFTVPPVVQTKMTQYPSTDRNAGAQGEGSTQRVALFIASCRADNAVQGSACRVEQFFCGFQHFELHVGFSSFRLGH